MAVDSNGVTILSSVGPAVNNLVTLLTAAIPETINGGSTQVVFGELPKYVAPVTLEIVEILGDEVPAAIGNDYRREETYSIVCDIVTWAGDQDYLKRYNDALSIWNIVLNLVGNNPWLSTSGLNDSTAAVRFAELGNMSIQPQTDAAGQSRCSLQFHVRCSQRINSMAQFAS